MSKSYPAPTPPPPNPFYPGHSHLNSDTTVYVITQAQTSLVSSSLPALQTIQVASAVYSAWGYSLKPPTSHPCSTGVLAHTTFVRHLPTSRPRVWPLCLHFHSLGSQSGSSLSTDHSSITHSSTYFQRLRFTSQMKPTHFPVTPELSVLWPLSCSPRTLSFFSPSDRLTTQYSTY